MTYETSKKDALEFVKRWIWTHTLSQEPKFESDALDRSAILTLYEKEQHLRFMLFYMSHQPALLFGLF